MATLMMKNGDIRAMGMELAATWQTARTNLKLSGKSTFALIGIKKQIEELTDKLNEAFLSVGLSHDGKVQEDGSIRVPPERIEEVNKKLTEIATEETMIDYTPIAIGDDDQMPTDLMDLFFNFIEMK